MLAAQPGARARPAPVALRKVFLTPGARVDRCGDRGLHRGPVTRRVMAVHLRIGPGPLVIRLNELWRLPPRIRPNSSSPVHPSMNPEETAALGLLVRRRSVSPKCSILQSRRARLNHRRLSRRTRSRLRRRVQRRNEVVHWQKKKRWNRRPGAAQAPHRQSTAGLPSEEPPSEVPTSEVRTARVQPLRAKNPGRHVPCRIPDRTGLRRVVPMGRLDRQNSSGF